MLSHIFNLPDGTEVEFFGNDERFLKQTEGLASLFLPPLDRYQSIGKRKLTKKQKKVIKKQQRKIRGIL